MQYVDKPSSFATSLKVIFSHNRSYNQSVALWILQNYFADNIPDFSGVMHPDNGLIVQSLAEMLREEREKDAKESDAK